jgi:hypothetical protein
MRGRSPATSGQGLLQDDGGGGRPRPALAGRERVERGQYVLSQVDRDLRTADELPGMPHALVPAACPSHPR